MTKANTAQLRNRFDGRLFQEYKKLRQFMAPHKIYNEKQVVWIAGVQRSGTNMMTQILERSLETDVYRESDPNAYNNYELLPHSHLQNLVSSSRARTVVFKALCELQDLKKLLDDFPDARAIWMIRRMEDMVNSHTRSVFVSSQTRGCGPRMVNISRDPLSEGWRGLGMSEETNLLLQKHIHPDITHESAVALFWLIRNRLFFELELDKDPRVVTVTYEDFVSDPHANGTALLHWLQLKADPMILKKVNARSVGRHDPPGIEPAIAKLCLDLYNRFKSGEQLASQGKAGPFSISDNTVP